MPASNIKINAIAASNDDLPINTLVNLDNANTGGEITFAWSIIDQPPGAADALSSLVIQAPTFTPKKEGTYLLQLVVNAGPAQLVNRKVVGVRQLKSRERVPAAQEALEDGARGWAGAAGSNLQRLDSFIADAGTFVAVNGAGGAVANSVVFINGTTTIKTGLPGQENIPTVDIALATSTQNVGSVLAVLLAGVDGNLAPAAGALVRCRVFGAVYGIVGVPFALGDGVFVSNTGALALSVGTNSRFLGNVIRFGAGTYDFWMSGVVPDPPFIRQDVQPIGGTNTVSNAFVDASLAFPDWTVTVPTAGHYLLYVALAINSNAAALVASFQVKVNGIAVSQPSYRFDLDPGQKTSVRMSYRFLLVAGSNTFHLEWHTSGGNQLDADAAAASRVFILSRG